ncbi:MAG: hypothetical protein JO046_22725, partial [Solirubrobacterales bacterium]|nr:hypothetical protein [Solirubrobacterales bacterium]
RPGVEREIKRFERRGTTARNRLERRVRRTRTRVERELRQRRTHLRSDWTRQTGVVGARIEKLVSEAQDRISSAI